MKFSNYFGIIFMILGLIGVYIFLGLIIVEVVGAYGILAYALFTVSALAYVLARFDKWMEDDDED